MNDRSPSPWPPYGVALAAFLGLGIAFVVVVDLAVAAAVKRGALPAMPDPAEMMHASDVAFGSPAKKLAVSIALNALLLSLFAVLASTAGLGARRRAQALVVRMNLSPPAAGQVVIAILGLIGLTTALDSIVQLLGLGDVGALADIRSALAPLSLSERLLFGALIGIGPGVTEELFFRGYLLNRISAVQGTRVGLVASSIIFGLFHADPVHTPLATVMGLYLGFCLLETRSLWVPIAAHAANNALAALTSGWQQTELQAALLIPLGIMACGAAITLLSRRDRLLSRRTVVW